MPPCGNGPLSTDSVEEVAPLSGLRQISALVSREARSLMGQLSSGQERLFTVRPEHRQDRHY